MPTVGDDHGARLIRIRMAWISRRHRVARRIRWKSFTRVVPSLDVHKDSVVACVRIASADEVVT